jgi:hypothetical protein
MYRVFINCTFLLIFRQKFPKFLNYPKTPLLAPPTILTFLFKAKLQASTISNRIIILNYHYFFIFWLFSFERAQEASFTHNNSLNIMMLKYNDFSKKYTFF